MAQREFPELRFTSLDSRRREIAERTVEFRLSDVHFYLDAIHADPAAADSSEIISQGIYRRTMVLRVQRSAATKRASDGHADAFPSGNSKDSLRFQRGRIRFGTLPVDDERVVGKLVLIWTSRIWIGNGCWNGQPMMLMARIRHRMWGWRAHNLCATRISPTGGSLSGTAN
jgi:hypothetical protein